MDRNSSTHSAQPLIDPNVAHISGVRLGTLVLIRWMAVSGQLLALLTVEYALGFNARLDLTLPTVMVSAIINLWFSLRADSNSHLTEKQSAWHLAFDLTHLSVLLFLTGGLTNPFAVLMLAPSCVSASILSRDSTKFLILASIGLVTGLAFSPFPLPWRGTPPDTPSIIMIGLWISLCFTLVFLALYMARLGKEGRDRARALAATRAALEHEQRLAELGTLAAAAAHELGTPLGTILLVSKELLENADKDTAIHTDLELIVEQTSRCRDILSELREHRRAGNETHFTHMPIEALLRESAQPYESRGAEICFNTDGSPSPTVKRTPELIHAFRNIIENATGFAEQSVQIAINWTEESLSIQVNDDGPGFDAQIIKRLGEPYITTRQPTPGKDGGMGLGLFIAKTLLERIKATVQFSNRSPQGASVTISWLLADVEQATEDIED